RIGRNFVATGTAHRGNGLRRPTTARVVGRCRQVGRTSVGVFMADPAAEVQRAVGGVDRREGDATCVADALVARSRRAAQVEGTEARGVVAAGAQVAYALLELAAVEQAGGGCERTFHHQD